MMSLIGLAGKIKAGVQLFLDMDNGCLRISTKDRGMYLPLKFNYQTYIVQWVENPLEEGG